MINITIGADGAPSQRKITLGNRYENNDEQVVFTLPQDFDTYNKYVIAVIKINSENITRVLPVHNNTLVVSSSLTYYSGNWSLYLMARQTEIDLDSEYIDIGAKDGEHVFISDGFIGIVNKSNIEKTEVDNIPIDTNLQIVYDDLLSLKTELEKIIAGLDSNISLKVENEVARVRPGIIDEVVATVRPMIADGKSAYEIAVEHGFKGTEEEWLASLDYETSEEFNSLAAQVKEDANTTSSNRTTVEQLATQVQENAAQANSSATSAQESATSASNSAAQANESKLAASASATAAEESNQSAITHANQAKGYSDNAKTSSDNADAVKTTVEQLAEQARTYSSEANEAAQSALEAAESANQSSISASASATSAGQSATSASKAASSATEAATNAEQSAQSAADSAQSARQFATSASQSANSASESAESAQQSATSAQESATSAGESATSAGESAESALQAEGFATQAQTSATQAASSASQASQSATNAAKSETNSANSASEAAGSAAAARQSASSAETSAQTATTKAQEAITSATNASTSESNAATSETNAQTYMNQAKTYSETASSEADRAEQATDSKLDKNQGIDNAGKPLVVGDDGNVTLGEKTYTKKEVDDLLLDKMDKPYADLEVSDNTTIEDSLYGKLKVDSVEGNSYQATATGIIPIPERPIPIHSKKVKVGEEYVELRSLKETGNIWDLKPFTNLDNVYYQSNDIEANCWGKQLVTGLISILKPNTTYSVRVTVEMVEKVADEGFTQSFSHKRIYLFRNQTDDLSQINTPIIDCQTELSNGETTTVTNTFTTPSDLTNVNILFYTERYTNAEGTAKYSTVKFKDITLIEGSTVPQTYIPPTIRDYKIVDHTAKTSKIVRNVGLYVDDKTGDGWNTYVNEIFPNSYFKNIKDMKKSNRIASYSNSFEVYDKATDNANSMWIGVSANSNVFVVKTDFTTLDEWKAWLKSDDLEFLYPLEIPTEESVTYVETHLNEVGYTWQDTTSPSPDVPSNIESVNSLKITVCGKNLFDINKVETFNQDYDGNVINNDDGSITVNTSSSSSGVVHNKKLSELANLKNGETYTLTADTTGNEKRIYLYEAKLIWDFSTSKIITQEMLDSRVTFYASGGSTSAIIANIQIEQGSTATEYEPYKEQTISCELTTPLRGIGDVADTIDIENGIIQRNIGVVEFDGSSDEDWRYDSLIYNMTTRFYGLLGTAVDSNHSINYNYKSMCDKFVMKPGDIADEEYFRLSCGQENRQYYFVYLKKSRLDEISAEAFKTWLASNPITIWYELINPTTESLPDGLLEQLKVLRSQQNVTNIIINTNVKPTLNVSYPQDKVKNLENEIENIKASLLVLNSNIGGN